MLIMAGKRAPRTAIVGNVLWLLVKKKLRVMVEKGKQQKRQHGVKSELRLVADRMREASGSKGRSMLLAAAGL
jgi:hypothetical protein